MSQGKDREIEILINGKVFSAELLWKDAPKTCELVYNELPIDKATPDYEYIAFSPPGMSLLDYLSAPPEEREAQGWGLFHTGYAGFCLGCDLARPDAPWAAPPENQKFVLQAGDCTWKTYQPPIYKPMFHQEMYICYRPTTVIGYRGVNLCNNFAKITDKLDELAAIGDKSYLKYRSRNNITLRKKK